MGSHIVSIMKAHDLLKLAWWWLQGWPKHVAIKNLWILMLIVVYDVNILLIVKLFGCCCYTVTVGIVLNSLTFYWNLSVQSAEYFQTDSLVTSEPVTIKTWHSS